jgi:hypothetical protein
MSLFSLQSSGRTFIFSSFNWIWPEVFIETLYLDEEVFLYSSSWRTFIMNCAEFCKIQFL